MLPVEKLAEVGSAALSLRAVARRAGLSHAAPAYAFGDRAGLLTAVATIGFEELATTMIDPADAHGRTGLSELGRRYVRFAQANPALYEVMFRPTELIDDDSALQAARAASIRALTRATRTDGAEGPPTERTMISWTFAHGAASLVSQGALTPHDAATLIDAFALMDHPPPAQI